MLYLLVAICHAVVLQFEKTFPPIEMSRRSATSAEAGDRWSPVLYHRNVIHSQTGPRGFGPYLTLAVYFHEESLGQSELILFVEKNHPCKSYSVGFHWLLLSTWLATPIRQHERPFAFRISPEIFDSI